MFEQLIEEIQKAVAVETVDIGGKKFTSQPVHEVPAQRLAKVLKTATLQSIVDYFGAGIDAAGTTDEGFVIHVASPSLVDVLLWLDDDRQRETRLQAVYSGHSFEFGKQYEQGEFITLLRSQFVLTDAREELQRFVGALTDESSLKLEDDGVSQKTVAKTGLTTVARVENNAPLVLAPFRTFPEIEQPESEFILRLHRRDGDVPRISLHEADNQAWKLEAVNRIAEWIKAQEVKVPILA